MVVALVSHLLDQTEVPGHLIQGSLVTSEKVAQPERKCDQQQSWCKLLRVQIWPHLLCLLLSHIFSDFTVIWSTTWSLSQLASLSELTTRWHACTLLSGCSSIHSSSIPAYSYLGSQGSVGAYPSSLQPKGRGRPWTGHQSITGLFWLYVRMVNIKEIKREIVKRKPLCTLVHKPTQMK